MGPTLGGVHKIQILIRDLLKEFLQTTNNNNLNGFSDIFLYRPMFVYFPLSVYIYIVWGGRKFINFPLVNPLLKSVSCVPPPRGGPFSENP